MKPEKPSVIVIDDKLGPRESLRFLLMYDYHVFCAESVDAGIELLLNEIPESIILDLNMPGKDGIQGLAEIRHLDPIVSVIILTGHGSLETKQKVYDLGAFDYVTKPYDIEHMRTLVKRSVDHTIFSREQNVG